MMQLKFVIILTNLLKVTLHKKILILKNFTNLIWARKLSKFGKMILLSKEINNILKILSIKKDFVYGKICFFIDPQAYLIILIVGI